ncbi:MAG: FkbM family methyltransferase [Actinomycetota bacterium]
MRSMRSVLRQLAGSAGFDLRRYPRSSIDWRFLQRFQAFPQRRLLLDVGANRGQFATRMLGWGYADHLWSFEPLSAAFDLLEQASATCDRWRAFNIGFDDHPADRIVSVASNGGASSTMASVIDGHATFAPTVGFDRTEQVKTQTLHAFLAGDELATCGPDSVALKLDTQGWEVPILDGARDSLATVDLVLVETSVQPLYQGGSTFAAINGRLEDHGFRLVDAEPTLFQPGSWLVGQIDAVYERRPPS